MESNTVEALLDCLEGYLKGQDGRDLPNGQRSVLYACLSKPSLTYADMADWLRTQGLGSYKPDTLKNDAHLVYKRLGKALNNEIKKKNCHRMLLNWYDGWRSQTAPTPAPITPAAGVQSPSPLIRFTAWEKDLADLAASIRRGRRIVCIKGAARAGKTYLTHALIEQIQSDFEAVIHCQALDVLTPDSLHRTVRSQFPHDGLAAATILALTELLQTRRILLVIDQTEVLLQPKKLAGQFEEASIDYEAWLRRLLEIPALAGCLIWGGQEPPACFEPQYYSVLSVHQVSELAAEDAATLLAARDMTIAAIANWEKLVRLCGGNPAWLLMEIPLLQRSPTQDVSGFLANPSLDRSLVETLQRVLARLSDTEHLLLFWLLLKPVSYDEIRHLDIPGVLPSDLEYALTSLEGRSLVRLDADQCYRSDPPLLEYVLAEQVVRSIEAELVAEPLRLLHQYRLFHGSVSVQRQRWQQEHLLADLARRFRQRYGFRQEQLDAVKSLLAQVRQTPIQPHDAAVTNLLNLAITLGLPIAQLDVSGLQIRHVDLRQADLQQANLSGCTFQDTLLPHRLTGRLTADLSPDGGAIAAGDQDGHLLYWQRQDDALRLCAFCKLPAPIDQILFQSSGILILVSDRDVYSWWPNGEAAPEKIIELPERASSLAHNNVSHLVIGLVNGQLLLWNEISRRIAVLNAHRNEVCNLSFSSDGLFLASVGMGNRVLLWRLPPANGALLPYQELPSGPRICLATGWNQNSLLRAEVYASQICLRSQTALIQEKSLSEGEVVDLRFSKNGHHLAGTTDSGLVFCWDWQAQRLISFKQRDTLPIMLGACAEGRWLLLLSAGQIQLYDAHQQESLWETSHSPVDLAGCRLGRTRGLTTAEKELVRSLGAEISDG